jgi:hypothetical protein
MPQYSGSYAKPRLDLGQAFIEYVTQTDEFIGIKALTLFETQKKAAAFSAIMRESITSDADTKRAADGGYNRVQLKAKDKDYNCKENGLEGPLSDDKRALYSSDFNAELVTTNGIGRKVLQVQEKRIADLLFNTTTWTGAALYTDYSSAPWDNVASDIRGQIRASKEKVRINCGLEPNALIINKTNLNRIVANTAINDAVKYTSRTAEQVLINALADMFDIPNILIAKGIRNSANEEATYSGAEIWSDDYAMVAVIATDRANLEQPCVGRTFLWVQDSPDNLVVEQYREESKRSDIFRVRQYTDEKVIDPYFAHLLKVDA